jgi:hypothetical protein
VQSTFVRGIAVYKEGGFPSPSVGREHRREARIKAYR